jgi:mycothiol synthase
MPDIEITALRDLDPSDRAAVRELVARVTRERGASPLGDPATAQLGGATEAGAPATGGDDPSLGLLVRPTRSADPVGFALLDGSTAPPGDRTWTVAVAVPATTDGPGAPGDGPGPDRGGSEGTDPLAVTTELLRTVVDQVRRRGGGQVRWWAPAATPADGMAAEAMGFAPERTLLQLRCALPLPPDPTGPVPGVPTRAFRPGRDEDAWLVTNNRAFAGHPEQGGWDRATLEAREREPWFDPEGFRILEEHGDVIGFCWTKIHADTEPPLGEIYVIGVDPSAHGRGLGRALVRDGLDWLAGRGLRHGMLYVDAANAAAVHLYRALGFVEHHADRAYVITVRPGPIAADDRGGAG